MAKVLDYPSSMMKLDALPRPGDAYQAYGLGRNLQPLTLCLILSDGSTLGYPYARAEMTCFKSLDGDDEGRGDCVITLLFRTGTPGTAIIITGSNLRDLYWQYGQRRVFWIWELPEALAPANEGAPVVHSIDVKEADSAFVTPLYADPAHSG